MTNVLKMDSAAPERMGRILLVEDEPTNMMILATFLRDGGFVVDEMRDGHDAWEALKQDSSYDLIITDRIMPRMDGLTLARNIKADARLREIPIIMQTAATSQDDVSEGISAGVYYYLTKPYEEQTLMALTRSALKDRQNSLQFEERLSRQRNALGKFIRGEFHIQTPKEAENLAFLLGGLFPRPELAATGLYELMLNAVEHGNLAIGYEEKRRLSVTQGAWEQEIRARLALPGNASKKAIVQFASSPSQLMVSITDEGQGFTWQPFLEIEPSRATQATGRGIAKANMISFDRVLYNAKGNQVQAIANLN